MQPSTIRNRRPASNQLLTVNFNNCRVKLMNQIVKTAENVNNEAPNTGEAKTFLARLDPTASKFRFLALSDGKKPIELYGSFEDLASRPRPP